MMAITAPPLIALIILSAIMGVQFAQQIGDSNDEKSFIQASSQLAIFINILQDERDNTCAYFEALDFHASKSQQKKLWNKVLMARNATNSALLSLTDWHPTDQSYISQFPTVTAFLADIELNRAQFNMTPESDCSDVMQYFGTVLDDINDVTKNTIYGSEDGQFYRFVEALEMATLAANLAGIKRTVGRGFFKHGYLDKATYKVYADASGSLDRFLEQAITSSNYDDTAQENMAAIQMTIDFIMSMENDLYANFTTERIGPELGQCWYDNMTIYIDQYIGKLQDYIQNQLLTALDTRIDSNNWQFGSAAFAVCFAILLCAPTAIWFARNNFKLTMKISRKLLELKAEKLKTDLLLNEMLPRSIVGELKAGRKVEPQLFRSATIFFSDILGFTTLSAKSQPVEIVTLLNTLYSTMDAILDRYSCYKVETIGDAYMVVSGVPKLNGHDHSSEICTMALDVLREVSEIVIPHMPKEHLLMRIGVHTGPVAAGIVGVKMPRYCLFGDTVNTASRMESSGEAMCIHLSQATVEHVFEHHYQKLFVCQQLENLLHIKGKGPMKTYWLMGKHGFPYEIDLEKSRAMVEQGKYWRFGAG